MVASKTYRRKKTASVGGHGLPAFTDGNEKSQRSGWLEIFVGAAQRLGSLLNADELVEPLGM